MRYSTIGITGVDLLFLKEDQRNQFISKINKLNSGEVFCLATDLKIAASVIYQMLSDTVLVYDETSPLFEELKSDIAYFKSRYVKSSAPVSDGSIFDDLLGDSTTSEFSLDSAEDSEDDLFASLDSAIDSSEIETLDYLKETEGERLSAEVDELVSAINESSPPEAINMYQSIADTFDRLPVRFRDKSLEDSLSEEETYQRRYILYLANNRILIQNLYAAIYRSKNRIADVVGLPINFNYDRPRSLRSIIYRLNNERKSRIPQLLVSLNMMLAPKKNFTNEFLNDPEIVASLNNELSRVFGEQTSKVKAIMGNHAIMNSLTFYYGFVFNIQRSIVANVYGTRHNFDVYHRNVARSLLDVYGFTGILPNQSDIFIRNYPNLTKLEDALAEREFREAEILNIKILRNSLLSDREFRSIRR